MATLDMQAWYNIRSHKGSHQLNYIGYSFILLVLAVAQVYMNEGNDEHRKKDYSNAIHLYTKGIKVNCKDDELKAKLYSNRATAHFFLGESFP